MRMSKSVPMRPRLAPKAPLSFAIVASQYNAQYTQALVDNAYAEINVLEPGATVNLVSTPGSFEIPLMVQSLAELERYQAIIALGVLFQGETAHAALVAQSVTNALMTISIAHRVPIIHEVLLVENDEQARARCLDQELNRGVEAARAAVAAARTLREIK
jgi:6,7-dimethyl-8-ribityllumazine synthase